MEFSPLKSGKTVSEQEIKAYRSDFSSDQYIYLLAGVHGDEVEGVYILDKLFKWLKESDIQVPLVVIPILNVDGYRNMRRINNNGVDLNRNLETQCWTSEAREEKYFPGTHAMSEPENIYLDSIMKKYSPKLIVSFHSWKRFINVNGDCMNSAKIIQKYNNYEIIDGEIQNHPTPGSLGTYAVEKYESPVLTFESTNIQDEDISLQEIWLENELAFKELLKSFQTLS